MKSQAPRNALAEQKGLQDKKNRGEQRP